MDDIRYVFSKWLLERNIWQMRLMNESDIDSYASSRGTSSFFLGAHIKILWQLGLLNADLVKCPYELNIQGLCSLGRDDYEQNIYADIRDYESRTDGWIDSAKGLPELKSNIKLLFHPFRYYVLYHFHRILGLNFSTLQMLKYSSGYIKILKMEIDSINQYSAKPEFIENIKTWNHITALCIALEPCFHQLLFSNLSYSPIDGYEKQLEDISNHWNDIEPTVKNMGIEQLEKMREALCLNAEMLDRNKDVHTLLRLTRGDKRLSQIRGHLGGAMVLLTMAETIRRATEKAFNTKLKEEDELGFGVLLPGVKESLYGTERPLNGNGIVKIHWLRNFGLDSGIRLRWYVEGKTEYHAIESILGNFTPIQLFDLGGHIVEKHSIAFSKSLQEDIRLAVFSFISIDGDCPVNLSAVKKAARNDEMFGMFFVPEMGKDFEFYNFTFDELEQILFKYCQESDLSTLHDRNVFHRAVKNATNANQLIKAAQKFTNNPRIAKGAEWGTRLMTYAWENPEVENQDGGKARRQIVEAVESALRTCNSNYRFSIEKLRTDSDTGKFVERNLTK